MQLPAKWRIPVQDPGDGMWHFWICGCAIGVCHTEQDALDWLSRNESTIAQSLYDLIAEKRSRGVWK